VVVVEDGVVALLVAVPVVVRLVMGLASALALQPARAAQTAAAAATVRVVRLGFMGYLLPGVGPA